MTEASCLSQHLFPPREGNIDGVYIIFKSLQRNLGNILGRTTYNPVFEPPDKDMFEFFGRYLDEWKDF